MNEGNMIDDSNIWFHTVTMKILYSDCESVT